MYFSTIIWSFCLFGQTRYGTIRFCYCHQMTNIMNSIYLKILRWSRKICMWQHMVFSWSRDRHWEKGWTVVSGHDTSRWTILSLHTWIFFPNRSLRSTIQMWPQHKFEIYIISFLFGSTNYLYQFSWRENKLILNTFFFFFHSFNLCFFFVSWSM